MDLKPLNIKLLYIVAISAIVVILFINQLVIQLSIRNRSSDANIINLAGKERMFSQNVAKTSLQLLRNSNNPEVLMDHAKVLDQLIADWEEIHLALTSKDDKSGLQGSVSDEITNLYAEVNPLYQRIIQEATRLAEKPDQINLQLAVETILSDEKFFLTAMDKIVSQYELEARGKVRRLAITEIGLTILLFLVLLVEIAFIFRPAFNTVRARNNSLLAINKKLNDTNRKLFQQEEMLTETRSLAKIGSWELHIPSGRLHCSDEFLRIFQLERGTADPGYIKVLERVHPDDREKVRKAMNDNFEKREPYNVEYRISDKPDHVKHVAARAETSFDQSGNPLVMKGVVQDITGRKEHERMSLMIQRKQNELEKQQEKMKSLAILEGEEKERMRFSMELHDGVGQILTALKIHVKILSEQELEDKEEYYKEVLTDVKQLVDNATLEIRRISNNLTPKLLMDFGLTEGINNLIAILLERTDIGITKNIVLGNKRYKEQVEISLFRIMQEILQNIIKHAEAHHVTIDLLEDNGHIQLKVIDDGKGFEVGMIKDRSNQSNGLINMKHRIDLLNGYLYIKSAIGNGCEILVNIPLK